MDLIERTLDNPTLETVQALCILSLWEWGNSGNLARSRARSGQAVQVAMELGIHEMDQYSQGGRALEGEDWRRDMARRTWWVVYVAQLTSALVSGTTPIMGCDDPRVQIHFPVCSLDDNTWPNWVNTVRQCSRVFAIVNTVYYSELAEHTAAWGGRPDVVTVDVKTEMKRQMVEIDRQIIDLMKQAEAMAIIELVPGGEEEVVRNQQMATRLGLAVVHIHIHRQQAFPEVSLFSKRICGLPQAPDFSAHITALESVSVPQALANGDVPMYSQSPAYQAPNNGTYADGPSNGHHMADEEADGDFDFLDEMWQPDTFPENLPAPWFARAGGAASLWAPLDSTPIHHPPVAASIAQIPTPSSDRRASTVSTTSTKPHRAWGVDATDKPESPTPPDDLLIFPPGISLARCATAAHTIVRLEVLHRSASIAMSNGPYVFSPWLLLLMLIRRRIDRNGCLSAHAV